MTVDLQSDMLERLARLEGLWRGKGTGDYPTIDAFRYEEELIFELDRSYPLLRYEQKTVLQPAGEPSHWELGFIRPTEEGLIEVSNAQEGGRVEVLRGSVSCGDTLRIELESVVLGHDPRLRATSRVISVEGNRLDYVKSMATTTTEEPRMMQHLKASLRRVGVR